MSQIDGIHDPAISNGGWLSRERVVALALVITTCIVGYLCYRLILPFLPSLAWALALAAMCRPLHEWINKRTVYPSMAAGISVFIVALAIVVPAIYVTQHLARETTKATLAVQESLSSGHWRSVLRRHAFLRRTEGWIESQLGLAARVESEAGLQTESSESSHASSANTNELPRRLMPTGRAADMLTDGFGTMVTGTAWLLMQLFVAFLTLFFFFRDRQSAVNLLRSLMPLSKTETDQVFSRVEDTIHATIYGSLVVALLQGSMGGLMFWWLGLPSPLFWGAVMALLAVVPVLGTFVIWAPTAAYLALQGDWTKALILIAWGGIAIGLIDNLLYPFLVGERLRFHTLLVFFAIAGGLAQFGASGVILGPLSLALAGALLDIWRRRTAFGGTLETGAHS